MPALAHLAFRRRSSAYSHRSFEQPDVLGALLALALVHDKVERDLGTFRQIIQPRALNGAHMNEHVRSAVIGLNEPVPLRRVEPFYRATGHVSALHPDPSRAGSAGEGNEK